MLAWGNSRVALDFGWKKRPELAIQIAMSVFELHQGEISRPPAEAARLVRLLGERHIVLVGLMGAGKTSVGKRLAQRLGLAFMDSDHAIEQSANMSVADIFALRGEAEFRAGERRVIARLLAEPQRVLATGGGAFMDAETRKLIRARGVSLWLKADLPLLMRRVAKRQNRPLLANPDPEGTMRALMDKRYPVYAEADVTLISEDLSHEIMVERAIGALNVHLSAPHPGSDA